MYSQRNQEKREERKRRQEILGDWRKKGGEENKTRGRGEEREVTRLR